MWVYEPSKVSSGFSESSVLSRIAAFSDAEDGNHSAISHDKSKIRTAADMPSARHFEAKRACATHRSGVSSECSPAEKGILSRYGTVYLSGLLLSGILLFGERAVLLRYVTYYAASWLKLFTDGNPLHQFSMLFLTNLIVLVFLFLLGLCFCGNLLVYAVPLCKSIGTGLIVCGIFLTNGWKEILLYIVFLSLAEAVLAQNMCRYCAAVSKSCAAARRADRSVSQEVIPRLLYPFLFYCAMQIFFCGISAALSSPNFALAQHILSL